MITDYSQNDSHSLPVIQDMLDLILLIEKRPPMYLGGNSLMRLRSFIDGWYFHEAITEGTKTREISVLNDFTLWLQEKFKVSYFPWDKIIALHAMDDSHALTLFFELFHQFLEERSAYAD